MPKKKATKRIRIRTLKKTRLVKTQEGQQAWTEAQIQPSLKQQKIIRMPKGMA